MITRKYFYWLFLISLPLLTMGAVGLEEKTSLAFLLPLSTAMFFVVNIKNTIDAFQIKRQLVKKGVGVTDKFYTVVVVIASLYIAYSSLSMTLIHGSFLIESIPSYLRIILIPIWFILSPVTIAGVFFIPLLFFPILLILLLILFLVHWRIYYKLKSAHHETAGSPFTSELDFYRTMAVEGGLAFFASIILYYYFLSNFSL